VNTFDHFNFESELLFHYFDQKFHHACCLLRFELQTLPQELLPVFFAKFYVGAFYFTSLVELDNIILVL
jgi:hypothetical protein